MNPHQNSLVRQQFGPTAADYVTSAVHADGTDLRRIAEIAAEHRPYHALDLGCGGGHVAYAIAPHASRLTACDLLPEMVAAVRAEAARRCLTNIETISCPANALASPDHTFDFLACRFSVHHWRDAAAGLSEVRRVLRPGSPAIFVDVVAPALAAADTHLQAVELLRDASHVRDYREAEWRDLLMDAGFVVGRVTKGRLRMDFADWTTRMRTPPERMATIRSLQDLASSEVCEHFEIEADGSFTLDTIVMETT